ncbi:MAG: hypothetical protein LBB78_08340 [Spirochaetaceae bacterium]|jgi:hypothetical protein|nr:hypothetical protein [Spirochaetaceae bacterium]
MKGFYDPIIAEVRRNREKLLEIYGGVDGLHKHMDDERPQLEKDGWHFVTSEEITALQRRHEAEG